METRIFKVSKIDGEYAYISPLDGGEDIFIAIALLPLGIDVGTLLVFENFSFAIYEEN